MTTRFIAGPAPSVSRSALLTGYRGVTNGTPRYALFLFVAISPEKSVSRRREKKGRLRRDDYADLNVGVPNPQCLAIGSAHELSRGNQRNPAILSLLFCAAMSPYKCVSRRREMKGRLRRDDYLDKNRAVDSSLVS